MSDRVYKQLQMNLLFDMLFTKRMLEEGKEKQLRLYVRHNAEKYKNGLEDSEVDAVTFRVEEAMKAQELQ